MKGWFLLAAADSLRALIAAEDPGKGGVRAQEGPAAPGAAAAAAAAATRAPDIRQPAAAGTSQRGAGSGVPLGWMERADRLGGQGPVAADMSTAALAAAAAAAAPATSPGQGPAPSLPASRPPPVAMARPVGGAAAAAAAVVALASAAAAAAAERATGPEPKRAKK